MSAAGKVVIGTREVGESHATYIIAEIGSNHNQDLDLALRMIEAAAEAGADAVKFQSIRYDRLYNPALETEEFRHWMEKIELDESWYPSLAERAGRCGVDFISAPTYVEAIPLLEACGVPAYKLASPQVQGNLELVRAAAATGKPLIMSMGYSGYGDVENAIAAAREAGNESVIPLHCVSKYPMDAREANLRYLQTLRQMSGLPTGFSDHSIGAHLAVAAVALGACVIEKHVTTDRTLEGPDHHFAMLFPEFKEMVNQIRDIEQALGTGVRMELLDQERQYRDFVALKVFAARNLAAGEKLARNSLKLLRCNCGEALRESDLVFVERCVAARSIAAGEVLKWDSLSYTGESHSGERARLRDTHEEERSKEMLRRYP